MMRTYSAFVRIGLIGMLILFVASSYAGSSKAAPKDSATTVPALTSNSPSALGEVYGIKITEWTQAFGSLIAIIAAIVGFIKLFRESKDQQSQIHSLSILAKESKEHTLHLSSQVDQMIQGNKLQLEYISLFQNYVSTNIKSL